MDNTYKNIEEYNPNKKRKILIVFDDIIANTLINKRLNSVVTELVIRSRELKISLAFMTQSYFKVPKYVRLKTTHFFIMKIPIKKELPQNVYNHSSDIDFKDVMNIYRKCTAKPYYFLVIDSTRASDNPLCFRKNLLERI